MAHDVFISYSTRDKTVADTACAMLEARGIRCWIAPRDIMPSADWGTSIIRAISQARVFVLILSSSANESPQVKREVERAVHNGIAIIPMRIEDVAPAQSLEYYINTPHWLDAFNPPLEAHLNYLADVIRQILSGVENAPTPRRARSVRSFWRPAYARYAIVLLVCLLVAGVGLWAAGLFSSDHACEPPARFDGKLAAHKPDTDQSRWCHNNSIMNLAVDGTSRIITYETPRRGMSGAGAKPGATVFEGHAINGRWTGLAYIFKGVCGRRYSYGVSGSFHADEQVLRLDGLTPIVDPDTCKIVGHGGSKNDHLAFSPFP